MADCTVRASLLIRKGNLYYQSQPSQVTFDLTNEGGPTPGMIKALTSGTDVSLSVLTTPGPCRIMNLDASNYVTVGIWEPDTSKFYPFLELGPGETYVFKLSRSILKEWSNTGTGVVDSNQTLRIMAANDTCDVIVEAFEA